VNEVPQIASDDRWRQLNRCPRCGAEMERETAVGERVGLYYRCHEDGRFRYSWDADRLEPVGDLE
jgi:hypothetical protein